MTDIDGLHINPCPSSSADHVNYSRIICPITRPGSFHVGINGGFVLEEARR